MRCSGVLPLPNMRSTTTCGFSSIGSGVDADALEIVFVYTQLLSSPQLLEPEPGSSTDISTDGSSVSLPISAAMIWSIVCPARTSAPAVFFGFSAHRNAAATQWSAPVSPGGGSDEVACRPVRIVSWSRNGSSGCQMNGSACGRAPSASGTQ
jgi:hypothetical protein